MTKVFWLFFILVEIISGRNNNQNFFLRDSINGLCWSGLSYQICSIHSLWKVKSEVSNAIKLQLSSNQHLCLAWDQHRNQVLFTKCKANDVTQNWEILGNITSGYQIAQREFCITQNSDQNQKIMRKCSESLTTFSLQIVENEFIKLMKSPEFQIFDLIQKGDMESLSLLLASSPRSLRLVNWDEQSPLQVASRLGNLQIVKNLLSLGSDPNHSDKDGISPFIEASKRGNVEIMKELISFDVDTLHNSATGQSPLWFATLSGNLFSVKFLLQELHLNPNTPREDGVTPLMVAAAQGFDEIAASLIEAGANVHTTDNQNTTALINAAEHGSLNLVSLLLQFGADVNQFTDNHFTPLIVSSAHGHLEIVQLLVRSGAIVDLTHPDGVTALMYASAAGHVDTVKYLLSVGADVNAIHSMGGTSLLEATASSNTRPDLVSALLGAGADVNVADHEGITPVISASATGNSEVVKILIKSGADLNWRCQSGLSALHYAVSTGQIKIIPILLRGGADPNLGTRYQGSDEPTYVDGTTPLLLAIEANNLTIVKIIAESRLGTAVDLQKSDSKGITPLLKSTLLGHLEIAAYLILKKVNPNDFYFDEQGIKHHVLLEAVLSQSHQLIILLLSHGGNVNVVDQFERSLLWHAASLGDIDTVQLLLSHQANPTHGDVNGTTILMTSLLNHQTKISHLLIDLLDPFNLQFADLDGTNALMIAAGNGHLELVKKLLKRGCDPLKSNLDGHNPLFFAYHGRSQLIYFTRNSSQPNQRILLKIQEFSQIIQQFLDLGVNPSLEDKKGRIALDFHFNVS